MSRQIETRIRLLNNTPTRWLNVMLNTTRTRVRMISDDSQHASVRVIRVVRVVSTADSRTELRLVLTTSSNRHRLTRRGCLRAFQRIDAFTIDV